LGRCSAPWTRLRGRSSRGTCCWQASTPTPTRPSLAARPATCSRCPVSSITGLFSLLFPLLCWPPTDELGRTSMPGDSFLRRYWDLSENSSVRDNRALDAAVRDRTSEVSGHTARALPVHITALKTSVAGDGSRAWRTSTASFGRGGWCARGARPVHPARYRPHHTAAAVTASHTSSLRLADRARSTGTSGCARDSAEPPYLCSGRNPAARSYDSYPSVRGRILSSHSL
jgi:hypothetical protein